MDRAAQTPFRPLFAFTFGYLGQPNERLLTFQLRPQIGGGTLAPIHSLRFASHQYRGILHPVANTYGPGRTWA